MVYASHVATTVWAILFHIWQHDFKDTALPAPTTFEQKLTLTGIYFPVYYSSNVDIVDDITPSVLCVSGGDSVEKKM